MSHKGHDITNPVCLHTTQRSGSKTPVAWSANGVVWKQTWRQSVLSCSCWAPNKNSRDINGGGFQVFQVLVSPKHRRWLHKIFSDGKQNHFLLDLTPRLPKAKLDVSWLVAPPRSSLHWHWQSTRHQDRTCDPFSMDISNSDEFRQDTFAKCQIWGMIVWHAIPIRSSRDWPIFTTTRSSTGTGRARWPQ